LLTGEGSKHLTNNRELIARQLKKYDTNFSLSGIVFKTDAR